MAIYVTDNMMILLNRLRVSYFERERKRPAGCFIGKGEECMVLNETKITVIKVEKTENFVQIVQGEFKF